MTPRHFDNRSGFPAALTRWIVTRRLLRPARRVRPLEDASGAVFFIRDS
jgi:hypothetical protein